MISISAQGRLSPSKINSNSPFNQSFYFYSQGNHGLVYKGTLETYNEDGLTEKKVAIKRLLHIDSNDISVYRDFVREAKLMKKLRHENIVKIYGFLETPLIIIMEYMPRTLHRHLNIHRSELRVEHLLQFAEDIARVS